MDIFRKLLGIPQKMEEDYFENRYRITDLRSIKGNDGLPLKKKITESLEQRIDTSMKKVDLDTLLSASFQDLSNECISYLERQGIAVETIVEKHEKIKRIPMITQV